MKLKNKKTGEIVEVESLYLSQSQELQLTFTNEKNERKLYMTDKISTFENEWEDYEEPKGYYYVTTTGLIKYDDTPFCAIHKDRKAIGNYFETKEEAEKAVEKLKAWKRLKDKGFRFTSDLVYGEYYGCGSIRFIIFPSKEEKYVKNDLELLFGGEE